MIFCAVSFCSMSYSMPWMLGSARKLPKAQPAPHEASADTEELATIKQAMVTRDIQTLQQWGGADATFKRMNELKRQLSPKEAATATVTSPIDSHSIWHSIRLTGIDFESLNWGQIDPPVTEKSCPKYAPNSEGGLDSFSQMFGTPRQKPNLLCLLPLQRRSQSRGAVLGLNGW